MKRQGLLQGTLIITLATFISKVLGGFFRIPLQNIAGDKVLGIFTLVFPVYMVALTLSVAGIPLAISRLISEARTQSDGATVQLIFRSARVVSIFFGLMGCGLLIGFSKPIAQLLGGQSTRPALMVVAVALLIVPYMAVHRGLFQGFNDMRPTAYSQMIEQTIRVLLMLVVGWVLTSQHAPNEKVGAGVMIGTSIGAFFSLIYLLITLRRSELWPREKSKLRRSQLLKWSKTILVLSIPISIGSLMTALLNLVDSLTVPTALMLQKAQDINHSFGVFGRGISLVQMATVFSTALIYPMVPAISGALARKDEQQTTQLVYKVNRLNGLFSWPVAVILFVLAEPINIALFGDTQGTWVVAMLGLSSFFNAQAILETGILTGIHRQKEAAGIILLACLIKIPLNFVLVPKWGLFGAALSSIIIYILILMANHRFLRLYTYRPKVDTLRQPWDYLGVGAFMGALMGGAFMVFHPASRLDALIYVVVSGFVGLALYGLILLKMNGLQELSGLPFFSKLVKKR